MKHSTLIKELAEKVQRLGGKALLVGGCVRDEIMKRAIKDVDIEIYGLEPDQLRTVLSEFGKVDEVGASFQVFKLGQDIDVSLPRREKKVGVGHKGFEVTGDPYMSFEEACSRRDFTINAIMKDPLTGEVIDPLGGVVDIQRGILKAVSRKTFHEDSLRVLRLVQFASRFGFDIDNDTFVMAFHTDLSDLPKERIWTELEKMFLKSPDPSVGVFYLQSLGIMDKLFPSWRSAQWMDDTLKRVPHFCNDLSDEEKLVVMLTLFCWASSPSIFDELGVNSVNGYPVRKRTDELLMHMPFKDMNTDYEFHKLSQKVKMKLLSRVIYCFPRTREFAERFADTIERLGIEEEPMKPVVTGKYLIQYGMNPSKEMGEALEYLYDLQMKGVVDAALWEMARNMCGVSDCSDERQPTEYPLISE